MATDYNKILLDKGYTQAQIDAMKWVASSWGSAKDIVNAGKSQPTQTTSSSVKQASDQRTQEVMNKANQTQSTLNSMSQSVAQNNSRNAQVGTGSVAWIQQNQTKSTPTTTPWATWTPISQDTVAKSWDSLSATQQKNALSRNKALNDYITSRWLTVKKEETPVTTTKSTPKQTTAQTPKQQQWDYQDNSQARMDEMARNLNWFRQTNPELFQDESMFYNFFIDWKGRSQDQIDYLWNYYNNVKKFWKYDNMPASALWDGLANWTIPQGYLDYVKAQDPQKYQEILSYKQDSEDRIKYESYLDDLTSMAWYDSEQSSVNTYPWAIEAARELWLLVDENEDRVDDRLYVAPTPEEQKNVDRINEINARRMEIKNMQKNLLDDLVEQYPWVPKATLMWIVQDRTKDISREYDDLWVELVQLQGTVDYQQNERKAQMDAWQTTIQNIDSAIKTYYNYLPWGIQELAQSKYAATNITLDQADSGNETQKQMALEAAITPIFEQYGDIIERSPAEVINDTIAYAKKNWVWLRQALQESFMDYLKEKPAYKAMQTAMTNSWWDIKNIYVDWEQQSIWYNPETWETKPISYSYNSSTGKFDTVSMNDWGEWDYFDNRETVVQPYMRNIANASWSLEDAAQNIAANMEWTYLWLSTCWYYVNDYIYWVTGQKWPFGSDIESKRNACNNKNWLVWAKVWDAVVFDWTMAWWVTWVLPEYWHVGIITAQYPDWSIDVSSSISWKVQTRTIKPWDAWYKNIYWTRSLSLKTERDTNPAWHPMIDRVTSIINDKNNWLTKDERAWLKLAETIYSDLYGIASDWSLDHFLNSSDFQTIMSYMTKKSFTDNDNWAEFFNAWKDAKIKSKITDDVNERVLTTLTDLIEKKLRDESWAAISSSEWLSNFENYLPQAWESYDTKLDKLLNWEKNIVYPTFRFSWMPEWYMWIFGWENPLFKWSDTKITQAAWYTSKWNWNFTTSNSWAWTVNNTINSNDPYSWLYNILNING